MRKKIELKQIENPNSRRESLKKRKQGLVKKVSELSTLCDINASVIIYSPNDPEPTIWPDHENVRRSLERYYNIPEMARGQKMVEQESYIKENIQKVDAKLVKQQKRNSEIEFSNLMNVYLGNVNGELNDKGLLSLYSLLTEKRDSVHRRLEFLQKGAAYMLDPSQEFVTSIPSSTKGTSDILPPITTHIATATSHKQQVCDFQQSLPHNLPSEFDNKPVSWDEWFYELAKSTMDMMGSNKPNQGNESLVGGRNSSMEYFENIPSFVGDFKSSHRFENVIGKDPMLENSIFSDRSVDIKPVIYNPFSLPSNIGEIPQPRRNGKEVVMEKQQYHHPMFPFSSHFGDNNLSLGFPSQGMMMSGAQIGGKRNGKEIIGTSTEPMFQNSLPFPDFLGDSNNGNDFFGFHYGLSSSLMQPFGEGRRDEKSEEEPTGASGSNIGQAFGFNDRIGLPYDPNNQFKNKDNFLP